MIHEHGIPPEDVFDPKIHLAYAPPTRSFTLDELKIQPSETSTDIAATVPFPILSYEGVRAYRRSLFSQPILQQCASSPYPGTLILRNVAEHSTFIHDFWTHPMTLRLVSDAAGLPLSIVMPTEIGHTNIQTSGVTMEEMIAELSVEPDTTKVQLSEEEKAYDPLTSKSIIPWHYDSYPYVCVLMLSDTEAMVGGETYIKGGDGVATKVEGPALGHGVFLQGGQVQHLAARGLGVKERISTITSYCANVPGVYDSSYITNIRPYSDITVLYKQWAAFRLEKLRLEVERLQKDIAESKGPLDVAKVHNLAENQIVYLKRTARQLIPYDEYQVLQQRFGRRNIQNTAAIWEKVQDLPEYTERVGSIGQRDWMPESPLWTDLAESQANIQAGRVLQAQTGRYKWQKARSFSMGDELLRQGLPELFLSWLNVTGLYALVLPMLT
ncbi:MAG: hypothetical protein M1818_001538 [Claussenomyces sp. TS43310]|nr:MAG: hypothetical protein M1818_001538 [Claussenomyces sp. TS43310]